MSTTFNPIAADLVTHLCEQGLLNPLELEAVGGAIADWLGNSIFVRFGTKEIVQIAHDHDIVLQPFETMPLLSADLSCSLQEAAENALYEVIVELDAGRSMSLNEWLDAAQAYFEAQIGDVGIFDSYRAMIAPYYDVYTHKGVVDMLIEGAPLEPLTEFQSDGYEQWHSSYEQTSTPLTGIASLWDNQPPVAQEEEDLLSRLTAKTAVQLNVLQQTLI